MKFTYEFGRYICVWNFLVFASYWDMRNDINGGDITSNNHKPAQEDF